MAALKLPRIVLSRSDHAALERLVDSHPDERDAELRESLRDELSRAKVLDDDALPPGTAGMNSRIVFRDAEGGAERTVQLVFPRDAAPGEGRVSVLAPVGCALLGLSAGQQIDWPLPGGRRRRLEVLSVSRPLPPADTPPGERADAVP